MYLRQGRKRDRGALRSASSGCLSFTMPQVAQGTPGRRRRSHSLSGSRRHGETIFSSCMTRDRDESEDLHLPAYLLRGHPSPLFLELQMTYPSVQLGEDRGNRRYGRPQCSRFDFAPQHHSFPTLGRSLATMPMSAPATTPLLRPTSARPQTAASSRPKGHSIVAILEGRGISREIGMATLNPETGRATIVQVHIYPELLPTKPGRNTHPILNSYSFQICPHMSRHYIKCISTTRLSSSSLTRLSPRTPRLMPRHLS